MAVQARAHILAAIERVGLIIDHTSGNGARLFPTHFDNRSIMIATELLDLVESLDFRNEAHSQAVLLEKLGDR